jgi:hypothetical protein
LSALINFLISLTFIQRIHRVFNQLFDCAFSA